jgi:hypothetical protein
MQSHIQSVDGKISAEKVLFQRGGRYFRVTRVGMVALLSGSDDLYFIFSPVDDGDIETAVLCG